jgi:hypothetical protein
MTLMVSTQSYAFLSCVCKFEINGFGSIEYAQFALQVYLENLQGRITLYTRVKLQWICKRIIMLGNQVHTVVPRWTFTWLRDFLSTCTRTFSEKNHQCAQIIMEKKLLQNCFRITISQSVIFLLGVPSGTWHIITKDFFFSLLCCSINYLGFLF